MPACPRDSQSSTSPPPGFAEINVVVKRGQLIELLQKIIEKSQDDPSFLGQQSKETDLLLSIAQLTLLSAPISANDRRRFLNSIVTIGQDLLTDENSIETNSCPSSSENLIPPFDVTTNDAEGDFSLDDLANEYLQNEPTPSSSSDKPTTSSESGELDLTDDYLSKNYSSPSTPVTNVLSALVSPAPSIEPILSKSPLENILFSVRLSSHDAADDADGIWKEESSSFGQIFCQKTIEIDSTVTKRISTCLLDRSLYERLTRLITLLPKQCVRNSVQQLTIRPNGQLQRPPHPNNDYRRQPNRPSFQQNSLQSYAAPRYANPPNSRYYSNSNFSNQQGNSNAYFVDRRSQQQQQQPNRYNAPYPADQQYQQRGPPKNNSYNNGYQQQKKKQQQQTNNQQAPNQYQQQQQQQRGSKKGSGGGGNKPNNDNSNAPGSDPGVNPK